jgi:hypothetical protein
MTPPPERPRPFEPQTKDWTGRSAVLLVHGIGNAAPGDYADVEEAVDTALGGECAVYPLYYDVFNDWFREKTQFATHVARLTGFLRRKQTEENLADGDGRLVDTIAEFAGDIIWPLFALASRAAVRKAYIAQLRQMVLDGMRCTGRLPGELHFSIICHSLGCFHTYEVLHTIANDSTLNLRPFTDGIRFRSVVYMASPVQLIRTFAESVRDVVPSGLASALASGLAIPAETVFGAPRKSVQQWVSVTGDLDPIGGYFLRDQAGWAYMNLTEPEAVAFVDHQPLIEGIDEEEQLCTILASSLREGQPPSIQPNNPHSWIGYIRNHTDKLPSWLA